MNSGALSALDEYCSGNWGAEATQLPTSVTGTNARALTDDEILNLGTRVRSRKQGRNPLISPDTEDTRDILLAPQGRPENSAAKQAGEQSVNVHDSLDACEFREAFATPELARQAKARLAQVEAIDALFFSRRPQDHIELARLVAELHPGSFASLTKAMTEISASDHRMVQARTGHQAEAPTQTSAAAPNSIREQFLFDANGAAVKGILSAIESQVDRVLPQVVSETARNRVIGEIYRELDASFQANDDLKRQGRAALQSGSFDMKHRDAIASLVTNRARQALPSATKRVMSEWASTMVASHRDRQSRQAAAENRVDIAGAHAAAERGRSQSPHDIDYRRMSDADILNL